MRELMKAGEQVVGVAARLIKGYFQSIAPVPAFIFVGHVQKHIARGFTIGAIK